MSKMRRPLFPLAMEAPAPALMWNGVASFLAVVERTDGVSLILTVAVNPLGAKPQGWLVSAIQTSVNVNRLSSPSETFERLAAQHAHHNVGSYPTAAKAFAAGESFARFWLARDKAASVGADCDCTDIDAKKHGDVSEKKEQR
jgi:hypothetical protein